MEENLLVYSPPHLSAFETTASLKQNIHGS
jgi:hypothetical protein